MGIDSRLWTSEKVKNTEHKFGETGGVYYPVYIEDENGNEVPAMFTKGQIDVAISRAARNPEDMPEDKSFFEKLFIG